MKKSIRIGDGIAEFFGTHDGNIKYLESLLRVQVHIDGENNITIDGDDHDVQLVERLVEDYAQLRGEGVKFSNGDNIDHNVTASDGSFNSGTLKPGGSFTFTFTKAGTYSYVCSIHPEQMTGKIEVKE